MRIAMIAPLAEAVPPLLYGGTERVVSALTEELVRRDHRVTLFASGDSRSGAQLVPSAPRALRLSGILSENTAQTLRQLEYVYERADDFDVIHNHVDWLAYPYARAVRTPTLSTMHGRLDLPDIRDRHRPFRDQPLVSISIAQRTSLPEAHWLANVYNGIDVTNFHYRSEPGDYLVFLGRICPEKRPDLAIEIARQVGMRLVIAAKVDPTDRDYYEAVIEPMLRDCPFAEYIGEVNEQEKDKLLGGAYAYLFPIDWPEPFGLTMAESMATGTPVIAMNVGSVGEVIEDGVTGFICEGLDEMVDAVDRVSTLRRASCRDRVERLFCAASMTDGYERAYSLLLDRQASAEPGRGADLSDAGMAAHR